MANGHHVCWQGEFKGMYQSKEEDNLRDYISRFMLLNLISSSYSPNNQLPSQKINWTLADKLSVSQALLSGE